MKYRVDDIFCGEEAKFVEVALSLVEYVCVKKKGDLIYIMNCGNGMEVYSQYGADHPVRSLTPQEYSKIIDLVKKEGVFDGEGFND